MNLAHAELRKLLTLPALRRAAVLTWAGTALLAWAHAVAGSREDPGPAPLFYAQAGFLVLGVLAAASEHQAGGQIRTTLLAMPRRLPLHAAKAGTLAAVTLPLAAAVSLTGTLPGGQAGRAPVAAAGLILTTVLAAAVAGLVRRAVPALVTLLVLYFIAGPLLRSRSGAAGAYLPGAAALDPSRGAAPTLIWALSAVALAALVLHRRDA